MDSIVINGLTIFAHHGVLPEERRDGQKFVVDLTLHADLDAARRDDQLTSTINYAEVAETVRRVMTSENNNLLERVAERIVQAIFVSYPLVDGIDASIRKPDAPMPLPVESVGVTISRWREEL